MKERPSAGTEVPGLGSSLRPARSRLRAPKCAAGPGSAAAPLRAGPGLARGPREPRAQRAEELGAAQKFPPNSGPARRRRRPLQPGAWGRPCHGRQGQGQPGPHFHFGGRGAVGCSFWQPRRSWERAESRRAPALATWEVALPAAAPAHRRPPIRRPRPHARCRGRCREPPALRRRQGKAPRVSGPASAGRPPRVGTAPRSQAPVRWGPAW
jgi:hypothetical protein